MQKPYPHDFELFIWLEICILHMISEQIKSRSKCFLTVQVCQRQRIKHSLSYSSPYNLGKSVMHQVNCFFFEFWAKIPVVLRDTGVAKIPQNGCDRDRSLNRSKGKMGHFGISIHASDLSLSQPFWGILATLVYPDQLKPLSVNFWDHHRACFLEKNPKI